MGKKRTTALLKTQSGKVFAKCYCSLFILYVHSARCVYIPFWSYFIWPFFSLSLSLSLSTQSVFSHSHLSHSFIHSFSRLFALNFVFIHYINSFLIEISPSEFWRIPTLVHHRWLVYFHKQHIARPRKVTRPFGVFFSSIHIWVRFMVQYNFRHFINLIFNFGKISLFNWFQKPKCNEAKVFLRIIDSNEIDSTARNCMKIYFWIEFCYICNIFVHFVQ